MTYVDGEMKPLICAPLSVDLHYCVEKNGRSRRKSKYAHNELLFVFLLYSLKYRLNQTY